MSPSRVSFKQAPVMPSCTAKCLQEKKWWRTLYPVATSGECRSHAACQTCHRQTQLSEIQTSR